MSSIKSEDYKKHLYMFVKKCIFNNDRVGEFFETLKRNEFANDV